MMKLVMHSSLTAAGDAFAVSLQLMMKLMMRSLSHGS